MAHEGSVPKRAAWGLADQAFSSLTNFALNAVVARSVVPQEFGIFALVFATYLLMLGISRSVTTLPLLVRFSSLEEAGWREGAASATGASLVLGAVAGVVCCAAGVVFPGVRWPLFALGLTLPGLLFQEAWRHSFMARGAPSLAFAADLMWALLLVPAIWAAIELGSSSTASFVLAWGSSGAVAGSIAAVLGKVKPRPRLTRAWVRSHWDLGGRQLGEFAAISGSSQLVMYVAGALGGLVVAGALRAGQVLLGPLHVALQGIWFVALPEMVRVLRGRPHRFLSASIGMSLVLGTGGLAYVALLAILGPHVGSLILGETWRLTRPLVVPLGIAASAWGFWLGASVGLRAMQQPKRSLRARVVVAIVTLLGGTIGVLVGGARGAAWGLAAAAVIGVAVWWRSFAAAMHDPREPVPESGHAEDEGGY